MINNRFIHVLLVVWFPLKSSRQCTLPFSLPPFETQQVAKWWPLFGVFTTAISLLWKRQTIFLGILYRFHGDYGNVYYQWSQWLAPRGSSNWFSAHIGFNTSKTFIQVSSFKVFFVFSNANAHWHSCLCCTTSLSVFAHVLGFEIIKYDMWRVAKKLPLPRKHRRNCCAVNCIKKKNYMK